MRKSAINNDNYVSKKVVLETFGISDRTLYAWVRARKIPYLRLTSKSFRYRLSDIEKALERHKVSEVGA